MSDQTEPTDKDINQLLHSLDPDLITTEIKIDFVRTRCVNCYISFYIPGEWLADRRKSRRTFYCPNGHGLAFPKPADGAV